MKSYITEATFSIFELKSRKQNFFCKKMKLKKNLVCKNVYAHASKYIASSPNSYLGLLSING